MRLSLNVGSMTAERVHSKLPDINSGITSLKRRNTSSFVFTPNGEPLVEGAEIGGGDEKMHVPLAADLDPMIRFDRLHAPRCRACQQERED